MKKSLITMIALSLSLTAFNQEPETPSMLNSIINPSQSRGYICWNNFEGADEYLIRIYEVDVDGGYSIISETFTTKNYLSIGHDYLSDATKSYSISAYSRGEFIDEGDRTPFIDGEPAYELCERKCNGSTYAYKLTYLITPVGIDKMMLAPALNIVDNTNDIYTPFYQAVSASVYAAMEADGHPYTVINGSGPAGPIWDYEHVPIVTLGGQVVGGPFYDKNNNVVTDGWLIEKKMDQFWHMNSGVTTADPGAGICAATMTSGGGWMAFYNAYDDETLYDPLPSLASVEAFTNYVPTSLQCDLSGSGGGGWSPNPGGVSEAWGNFINCVLEDMAVQYVLDEEGNLVEAPINLDPCFEGVTEPGTGVSGVVFEGLSEDFEDVVVTNGDGGYTVVGELVAGLYNIHVFNDAGGVLSTVVEVTEEDLIAAPAPISRAVDLVIAPNPIRDNMLLCFVTSTLETPMSIDVTNFYGELIYSSEEALSLDTEFRLELSVDPDAYPYGQIIINLTFPDGSTIQQIGLIE